MSVKFPEVTVQLSGEDGNAFVILGKTQRAMKQAGVSAEDVTAYVQEATSADYEHLLQTTMSTVNVL